MYLRVLLLLALISSVHLHSLDNRQLEKRDNSEKCIPNTVFKIDCNTCRCGPNGVAACTLMGCLGRLEPIIVRSEKN